MKKLHKSLIAIILFAIIIALAITTQPTQASLPGQTVPTAKPKASKTNSGSGGDQNTPASTNTPITIIAATLTSTGESSISIITPSQTLIQDLLPTNTAQSTLTQTPFHTLTETLIVPILSLTPNPTSTIISTPTSAGSNFPSNFMVIFIFVFLVFAMIVVGIVTGSRRNMGGKPPQS